MKCKPVFLEHSLLLSDALVVCDLHLGLEHELLKSGIKIPSQTQEIKKRIKKLVKQTKVKEIIFLGDIKHSITVLSRQEKNELPDFFKSFPVKVSIVKGNHDGNIEKFAGDSKVYGSKGMKKGNVGLVHGQGWPDKKLMECEYLVVAHNHSAVEIKEKFIINTEACWLVCEPNGLLKNKFGKCKIKQIIFMPAFNRLLGGAVFNRKNFSPIGPVFKFADWKKSEVFLTDGTFLGNLDKL